MRPTPPRVTCPKCRRADTTCYCSQVRSFETDPLVIVLVHPKERRKSIGTARIVRVCISNSVLIDGDGPGLDHDERLQAILRDPGLWPVVLFPGPLATNLSERTPEEIRDLAPAGRRLAILILDGTWFHARKMLRTSRTLSALPQIAFTPEKRSRYRIRKQPGEICLSTVEALHTVLRILGDCPDQRDNLLEVFDRMVDQQIEFEAEGLHT